MSREEWLASLQTFDWVLVVIDHHTGTIRHREQVVVMGDGRIRVARCGMADLRSSDAIRIEPLPPSQHGWCCRCVTALTERKAPWAEYCWECYADWAPSANAAPL